jgi:hypothetical protein
MRWRENERMQVPLFWMQWTRLPSVVIGYCSCFTHAFVEILARFRQDDLRMPDAHRKMREWCLRDRPA